MTPTTRIPSTKNKAILAFSLVCLLGLGACSDLSTQQQRLLTGGAIGATAGALSIALTGGCVACGAAIGGAVGAGTGYLYDYIDNKGY
ncbi:MAG: hypothetical protein PHD48_06515 [Alphaproteobacteria bacterium]|nr:hypothetical protein [Alphaproteobacteria bacterium]